MYGFNMETVASGSYVVEKITDKTLRAFLGSCVGVVVIDKEKGIAGLLHILLPEPPAKAAVDDPEKYASTAMPLFISAFTELGSKVENMKAYVAGGSLVGQVSMMDLKLDIGGQSAEVVANYLTLENIEIKKVETGGYLSTQMSVNLNKLECNIEPILNIHPALESDAPKQEKLNIENALQKIKPIPQIALKVIRMIHSSTITMGTIAEEIRQDQILTAKVLQLSNSAYVNPGRKVESIDKALILLGEKRILLLTLSVFTEMFYQQADQGYSLIKGGLFRHSIEVSFLADKLARFTEIVEPDQAFTAGLLHDIGKTVLDQAMASDYPLFYRKMMESDNSSLIEIEKEIFGCNHNEVGNRLAKKWSLPGGLADVIVYHHIPEMASASPELTHIVFLANILIHSFSAGNSLSSSFAGDMQKTFNVLKLTPEKLSAFIDSISWKELGRVGLV